MLSPSPDLLISAMDPSSPPRTLRAYSDPTIFRNDKVLKTLVRREVRLGGKNYCSLVQTEVKPHMRKALADWMLEICEEEGSQPEVFCLAVSYLDRFLSVCNIRRGQLQLLGAVCLLVAWKVREHSAITAQKLVEFTDFNVNLDDLLEWEFLLLSKLDWDLSAVIAPDFTEHILQRLLKLDLVDNLEATRRDSATLIYLSYCNLSTATLPPSLIAAASIVTTLRPVLEVAPPRDTPSPSSSSSASTHSTPDKNDEVDRMMEAISKITSGDVLDIRHLMHRLEQLMRASLPPSPKSSDDDQSPISQYSSSSPIIPSSSTSRSLFPDKDSLDVTPTKLLDAAQICSKIDVTPTKLLHATKTYSN